MKISVINAIRDYMIFLRKKLQILQSDIKDYKFISNKNAFIL